uniref:Uncharacterized protein n=1 Tax=Anguilla anguilla TaxID=7936 RepID=A0A0E9WZ18_ANGAN
MHLVIQPLYNRCYTNKIIIMIIIIIITSSIAGRLQGHCFILGGELFETCHSSAHLT